MLLNFAAGRVLQDAVDMLVDIWLQDGMYDNL